jgi:hypothetical protein
MALTGALLPIPITQWFDTTGDPLSAGKLFFYIAGTSTPQDVFSDNDLTTAITQPVILNSAGRPTIDGGTTVGPIYISPTGYKVVLKTSADVVVWTADEIADPSTVFLSTLGQQLAAGAKGVTSGYTVIATDYLITVDSTGGPNPCIVNLPTVVDRGAPIVIKNIGTTALAVTPNGVETVDTIAGALTIPAATGSLKPSARLLPDNVSNWWIDASHGVV